MVPIGGDNLEFSVSCAPEKMAACHVRVLIILLEYEKNRKSNSSLALRERYFCGAKADAHFSVPLSKNYAGGMKKKKRIEKKSNINLSAYACACVCVFFLPSLWNYPFLTSPHIFEKCCIPWRAIPPSPLCSFSASFSSLDNNHLNVSLAAVFWGLVQRQRTPLGVPGFWKTRRVRHKPLVQIMQLPWCYCGVLSRSKKRLAFFRRPLQQEESMSQEYIKIVPMSSYKSKLHGSPSPHFLI